VQNQRGAVQPYLVFHGARTLQVGQRGFQQAGGLVHLRKAAGQKRQPRAQAGVQRSRRRDRIHPPRRRQVAQQIEGGGEAFWPAAKVEGQHGGGRQVQGGAHRLIAVGRVAGGVAAAAFGALQTAGGAAATRVLAPQGGGAQ